MLDTFRGLIWDSLVRLHDNVRVVAFLRACSIVGMVGGILAFAVGLNPVLGTVALGELSIAGEQLPKIGIAGLFTYLGCLFYYKATTPTGRGAGVVEI